MPLNEKDGNIQVISNGKTWTTHFHILRKSKVLYDKLESKTPSKLMGTINLNEFQPCECLWVLHCLYQDGCKYLRC